jgi:hypothetical protein
MSYYTIDYLTRKGQTETFSRSKHVTKSFFNQKNLGGYDIFLSHSFQDKNLIQGIYQELSDFGFTVYVDWIVDGEDLDRSNVSIETAQKLKERMNVSKCLIFAFSDNSFQSYWTQWELGYMDAKKGKCAILPIQQNNYSNFSGKEYFKLYPYIDKEKIEGKDKEAIWVNSDSTYYKSQWKDKNYRELKNWI